MDNLFAQQRCNEHGRRILKSTLSIAPGTFYYWGEGFWRRVDLELEKVEIPPGEDYEKENLVKYIEFMQIMIRNDDVCDEVIDDFHAMMIPPWK